MCLDLRFDDLSEKVRHNQYRGGRARDKIRAVFDLDRYPRIIFTVGVCIIVKKSNFTDIDSAVDDRIDHPRRAVNTYIGATVEIVSEAVRRL